MNATERRQAVQARYQRSDKGRAAQARWRASDKGRATKAAYNDRYNNSEAGRAAKERYEESRIRTYGAGFTWTYRVPPERKAEVWVYIMALQADFRAKQQADYRAWNEGLEERAAVAVRDGEPVICADLPLTRPVDTTKEEPDTHQTLT